MGLVVGPCLGLFPSIWKRHKAYKKTRTIKELKKWIMERGMEENATFNPKTKRISARGFMLAICFKWQVYQ